LLSSVHRILRCARARLDRHTPTSNTGSHDEIGVTMNVKTIRAAAVAAVAVGLLTLGAAAPAMAAPASTSGSQNCPGSQEICRLTINVSNASFFSFVTSFPGANTSRQYYIRKNDPFGGTVLCSGSMGSNAQKSCSFAAYTGTITFEYDKLNETGRLNGTAS
jgi:hypothetical protein